MWCKPYRPVALDAHFFQVAHGFPGTFAVLNPAVLSCSLRDTPPRRLNRIYVRNAEAHAPMVLPRQPWAKLSDHAPLAAEIMLWAHC